MRKILSIDGGGIRGIIPLSCLVALEIQEGKPCTECFDMIAGTSTGAIIAGGLALGVSARGLLALYKDLAKRAFEKLPWWKILANGGNHRYQNDFISQTLTDMGGDIPLNELPIDIMITGKNVRSGKTDFFVRDNSGNRGLWGEMPLKDAVLASIAAPTYFPAHSARIKGKPHTWVDGGVGVAGNPCYQAAVEALHFSDGKYQSGDTRMLSFGTGRSPHPIDAHGANLIDWGLWVLDELLEDTGEWQASITQREYDETNRIDFRRYQLDLAEDVMGIIGVEIPKEVDVSDIDLDAVWAIELLSEIGKAFADQIDFDDPDGLQLRTELGW
jgi:patatin-like phospholipase/acyl hydrolase